MSQLSHTGMKCKKGIFNDFDNDVDNYFVVYFKIFCNCIYINCMSLKTSKKRCSTLYDPGGVL